jgi:predicted dehydrogenase
VKKGSIAMSAQPLRVGIVGCGNIAGPYAKSLAPHSQIEFLGATDIDPARAQALVAEYGGVAYPTLDDMLADDRLDLVINLTIHHAHPAVITQCLRAGKHVHSEKPLALTYPEAQQLVALAEAKGLRLSCAPITYMGEAQQTTWKAIRDGILGPVRVVYCEVNWGRIESWHPNPGPFYQVGALFDVGVYPLTLVTTFFGPARRVTAFGTVLHPDRVTKEGIPFHIDTPDWVVAAVELANGTVVRLTANFYVGNQCKQKGLEFHGDLGSLHLGSFQDFHASVETAPYRGEYTPLPYVREPYQGIEWGRAVVEMAEAIEEGRPQRATGAQAAHVVEILSAIQQSYTEGRPVAITSDFTPPSPMPWAG